jgi:hypothetical protein
MAVVETASDLLLRRKWTLKAHGKQVVFVKKAKEQSSHVLLKALLWALYLPDYPNLSVEIGVGDRYKPDVVARGHDGHPLFWGEAGRVGIDKIHSLARRYRNTHFAIAKWNTSLDPLIALVSDTLAGLHRTAPFDLLSFPAESTERFIDLQGHIRLTWSDVKWARLR